MLRFFLFSFFDTRAFPRLGTRNQVDFDRSDLDRSEGVPLSSRHSLSQVGVRADLGCERLNPSVSDRSFCRTTVINDVQREVDEQDAERRRGHHRHGQGERRSRGGGCRRSGGGEEAHFGVCLLRKEGKKRSITHS